MTKNSDFSTHTLECAGGSRPSGWYLTKRRLEPRIAVCHISIAVCGPASELGSLNSKSVHMYYVLMLLLFYSWSTHEWWYTRGTRGGTKETALLLRTKMSILGWESRGHSFKRPTFNFFHNFKNFGKKIDFFLIWKIIFLYLRCISRPYIFIFYRGPAYPLRRARVPPSGTCTTSWETLI